MVLPLPLTSFLISHRLYRRDSVLKLRNPLQRTVGRQRIVLSGFHDQIALTGLALMLGASVVTTFAGVIADPVQVMLGLHRRRLLRMIERLDRGRPPPGIGEEQLLARLGDLGDGAAALWRWLR